MEKNCDNCEHSLKYNDEEPCNDCNSKDKGESEVDNINKATHYNQGKIETIDYLESCLTREEFKGFLKGNIIKYTSRERLKGGIEDIKKGEYYKKKLITLMETGK